MEILPEDIIIEKIRQRETFTATNNTGAFTLKIEKYKPALSAAINNIVRQTDKRFLVPDANQSNTH